MSSKRRQSKNNESQGGTVTRTKRTSSTATSAAAKNATKQWSGLCTKILADARALSPSKIFGDSSRRGAVYRWGTVSAFGGCDEDPAIGELTRLAGGTRVSNKNLPVAGLESVCQEARDRLSGGVGLAGDAWEALIWAAALPGLTQHFGETHWWSALEMVQDFRDRVLHSKAATSTKLIGTAEIGLTLAWKLRSLPSCRRLAKSSWEVLHSWLNDGDDSVAECLSEPHQVRLVLASLLRCRMIVSALEQSGDMKRGRGWRDAFDEPLVELATWITAMTRRDGSSVFDPIGQINRDDGGPDGLLMRAGELEPESLAPAIKSAVGITQTNGKLAWQVSLPESMLHEEEARVACLLPEWDVRRGRLFANYARPQVQLELLAGKTVVLSGEMETEVNVAGTELTPRGDWVSTCEYTDDDVHYLEIEQPLSAGYVLQRQLMLIREDRCCLIADAVLRGSGSKHSDQAIEYRLSIPLAGSVRCACEKETSELFLVDEKPQAMVLPLSANEWRGGGTQTVIGASDDGRLSVVARGRGQLYVPLWFDTMRSRFRKKRTWRQLTVAQELSLVTADVAAAFRIQVGREQWIWYRSMSDAGPRTFFGKHMIADFYGARFDAKSESFEDLITVDDERDEEQ